MSGVHLVLVALPLIKAHGPLYMYISLSCSILRQHKVQRMKVDKIVVWAFSKGTQDSSYSLVAVSSQWQLIMLW